MWKRKIHGILRRVANFSFLKLFFLFYVDILPGYKIYKRLVEKYGEDTAFLTCQHRGTGDVYNIGSYFQSYLENHGIKKYVFLFCGTSEQKVGLLFGIQNNVVLSGREIFCLMRFVRFIRLTNVSVVQLHHYILPIEATTHFENFEEYYKGITFVDTFKKVTMGLENSVKPALPCFSEMPNIEEIFARMGLREGKTMIIAPYSSSAQILTSDFWEGIVLELKELGFTVVTNCVSQQEVPIPGSVGLAIEYKYMKSVLERAGYFLGARSGLCDIINTISCKKIVLTPYWSPNLAWLGTPGKTLRFYGMFPNYRRYDTIEIEYDEDTMKDIPQQIIRFLQRSDNCQREISLVVK